MQVSNLKTGRLAVVLGFLSSLAVGCVIGVGQNGKTSDSCPEDHSYLDKDKGECFCDANYEWCDPNDAADLTCCPSNDSSSQTNNTPAQTDTTNSTPATEGTSGGTSGDTTVEPPTTSDSGTTGEPLDCVVTTPVPESCDPGTETALCLAADNPDCGPQGSKYYSCEGGQWVQAPATGAASCINDGYDFSYGCQDNAETMLVEFVCGDGPGSDCIGEGKTCNGDNELNFCVFGKLGAVDCLTSCMTDGDGEGIAYDFGYCGDQGGATCICCDEGVDDCPLGGGTSTGGGDTGGSSTGG